MARPIKKLTTEQINEVETLAAVLSVEQMADYFGVCRTTFFDMLNKNKNINELYKKGRAKAIGVVAKGLLMRARDGDTTSAIFYLKTQAGWKEPKDVNLNMPQLSELGAFLKAIDVIENDLDSES